MIKAKRESGVTLVELLAALTISAFLVAMASRVFLSGNRQFLARMLESDRLSEVYALKAALQKHAREQVRRCDSGKLWVQIDGKEMDVQALLKPHFQTIQSAEFHCFERSGNPPTLVTWQDWSEPALIEYQVVLLKSGVRDTLVGSWIK